MKQRPLFTIALLLVATTMLFAAATGITYNTAVTISEKYGPGQTFVMYSGVTPTTVAADSIGDFYTKAMSISEFSASNAFFNLVCYNSATGTEDMNVIVEYSYNLTDWFVGSAASGVIKDQLTTTRVADTLNIIVGAVDLHYKTVPWMRLHFDLQAGNPIGTYATWAITLRKDSEAYGLSAGTANKR